MIVGFVIYLMSYNVVELGEVGAMRGVFDRKFDKTNLYYPGRYFLGPLKEFIKYPTTWTFIEFSTREECKRPLLCAF